MKIYVASSWRNSYQDVIVALLRANGHKVYDFKNPAPGNTGFAWSAVDGSPTNDPRWKQWKAGEFRDHLKNPIAVSGFNFDMNALRDCQACVLVLPCGRSAHLELGWACGAGKKTAVLMMDELGPHEPELMYSMLDAICTTKDELLQTINSWQEEWQGHSLNRDVPCHACGDLDGCHRWRNAQARNPFAGGLDERGMRDRGLFR